MFQAGVISKGFQISVEFFSFQNLEFYVIVLKVSIGKRNLVS